MGGARLKPEVYTKPLREVGSFFALSLDIMVQMVRPPFAWREFISSGALASSRTDGRADDKDLRAGDRSTVRGF